MIPGYNDHSANERTFLAWVRTGIAVMGFGLVIEKFDLLTFTMATIQPADSAQRAAARKLLDPFGPFDGLALVAVGLCLVIAAAERFVRTRRLLEDPGTNPVAGPRAELILSATLAILVTAFTVVIALGR
jgi:inner membrane protein YidH